MSAAARIPEPEEVPEPTGCPWCGEDCGGGCPETLEDEARDWADLARDMEREDA
jgi:hypothetical protein